jgi:hypothetical protein
MVGDASYRGTDRGRASVSVESRQDERDALANGSALTTLAVRHPTEDAVTKSDPIVRLALAINPNDFVAAK